MTIPQPIKAYFSEYLQSRSVLALILPDWIIGRFPSLPWLVSRAVDPAAELEIHQVRRLRSRLPSQPRVRIKQAEMTWFMKVRERKKKRRWTLSAIINVSRYPRSEMLIRGSVLGYERWQGWRSSNRVAIHLTTSMNKCVNVKPMARLLLHIYLWSVSVWRMWQWSKSKYLTGRAIGKSRRSRVVTDQDW